ncbi:thiamine-phosphate pyrophosphorylase [Paraburkholderia atlantica]
MTQSLTLKDRDLFWPTADELIEAAERIRARLGDWPPTHAPWRICLTAPDEPNGGDLIVIADAQPHGEQIARWLTRGAGVIVAAENRATLHLGGEKYGLEGHLAEDWIAALAAFLDCGFDPHDALVLALAWRDGDETRADDAFPSDLGRFPRLTDLPPAPARAFARCPDKLGLYPVLPTADWVERVVGFGVKTVQLRRKSAEPADELKREIARCVAAGRAHDAQVFINDHWQAALEAGAYGVHLGQEDVHTADLSALANAGIRLGLSTHGFYEMLKALHFRPSYIALGAVFPDHDQGHADRAAGLAAPCTLRATARRRRAARRDRRDRSAGVAGRTRNGRRLRSGGARGHGSGRPGRRRFGAATHVYAIIVRHSQGTGHLKAAFA